MRGATTEGVGCLGPVGEDMGPVEEMGPVGEDHGGCRADGAGGGGGGTGGRGQERGRARAPNPGPLEPTLAKVTEVLRVL